MVKMLTESIAECNCKVVFGPAQKCPRVGINDPPCDLNFKKRSDNLKTKQKKQFLDYFTFD